MKRLGPSVSGPSFGVDCWRKDVLDMRSSGSYESGRKNHGGAGRGSAQGQGRCRHIEEHECATTKGVPGSAWRLPIAQESV